MAPTTEAGCRSCRQLVIDASQGALSGVQAAQRDAHLAGCLSCRTYARHHSGILSLLPVALLAQVPGLIG